MDYGVGFPVPVLARLTFGAAVNQNAAHAHKRCAERERKKQDHLSQALFAYPATWRSTTKVRRRTPSLRCLP